MATDVADLDADGDADDDVVDVVADDDAMVLLGRDTTDRLTGVQYLK